MKDTPRIVFMGTPEFAVSSLEAILAADYKVVGVVTAPDKPRGRGLKVEALPVKKCAEQHRLPLLQPANLKDPIFLKNFAAWQPDLLVIVAFRMLPAVVWQMPRLGAFNLHASLLPHYRGAAPIHWAIMRGERETGVTTFLLKHTIDTGAILLQEKEPIFPQDTTGSLSERLMQKGAALTVKTIDGILQGTLKPTPQPDIVTDKIAPKLTKSDGQIIPGAMTTDEIVNKVRGLNPFPGAWLTLQGKFYKIWACHSASFPSGGVFNAKGIYTDQKTCLFLRSKDGSVAIDLWQPEGKKAMTIADYLRGQKL